MSIKKSLIRAITATASFLTKRRKISVSKGKTWVNLGCGLHCLPGWINIDGSLTALLGSRRFKFINKALYRMAGSSEYYSWEEFNGIVQKNNLRFYDLRKGVPLKDNSADFIYASHFLEHLGKKDGNNFLKECFRALKEGGLMRIAVPDLDKAFEMYQKGETEKMLDLFFYTSDYADFSAHKYNYNFSFIKEVLERAGFREVAKKDYISGECPNLDFLDVYPEHSLYVECRK